MVITTKDTIIDTEMLRIALEGKDRVFWQCYRDSINQVT